MSASSPENASLSKAMIARQVGHMGHELHNVLTVFFGVSEEVQITGPEAVSRALDGSIQKTEQIAKNLFQLREVLQEHERFDARRPTAALAESCPKLAPVHAAIASQEPLLIGDEAHFEVFLWALLQVASRRGGFQEVQAVLNPRAMGPTTTLRLEVEFAQGAPTQEDWKLLGRAATRMEAGMEESSASGGCAFVFPAVPPDLL